MAEGVTGRARVEPAIPVGWEAPVGWAARAEPAAPIQAVPVEPTAPVDRAIRIDSAARIDWAARVAEAVAARQRHRDARAELRGELLRRRGRWLAHRHHARLAHHGHPREGRGTEEGGST